jgi:MFS family permease
MTNPERTNESETPEASSKRRGYLYTFLSLHLPAVALGFGQGIVTPVLPVLLIQELNVSVELAALVFVATMSGGFTASIPVGYALDRFGRRRILLAGPIVIAASAFLIGTAAAGSFVLILLYRYIGGWGQQMWQLSRLTVIADSGGANRGRLITSMFGIQRAGNLAAPIVGGLIALQWGLYVPFIVQGFVVLLAVIPSFKVIQETMPSRTGGRGGGSAGGASAPADSFAWKSLLQPPIPAMYLAQLLGTMTRGGAIGGGTIFLFGVAAYGATSLDLGIMSSSMALVGIPLTLLAGMSMDKFGRKVTIVPGLILLGIAMAFLAAVAAWELPFYAFVIGFVWMQLVGSLLAGSMQTMGTDIAPPGARGRFFGVGRMVSQAGFMSNPLSFSILTAVSGFTAAFAFFAFAGVASGAILGFFVHETLHRDDDTDKDENTPEAAEKPAETTRG